MSPRLGDPSPRAIDVVFKELAYDYKHGMLQRFEVANQVQTIAAYLANRFCEDLHRRTGKRMIIEFLKTKTLVIQQEGGESFFVWYSRFYSSQVNLVTWSARNVSAPIPALPASPTTTPTQCGSRKLANWESRWSTSTYLWLFRTGPIR